MKKLLSAILVAALLVCMVCPALAVEGGADTDSETTVTETEGKGTDPEDNTVAAEVVPEDDANDDDPADEPDDSTAADPDDSSSADPDDSSSADPEDSSSADPDDSSSADPEDSSSADPDDSSSADPDDSSSADPEDTTDPEPVEGPEITIGNITARAGETVKVPVKVADNTGIWAVRAHVKYDTEVFTFTGIESGIFVADPDSNYADDNGTVTVFFENYDEELIDITDDGVLFTLKFTVNKNADCTTPIEVELLDVINVADGGTDVAGVVSVDGSVTVIPNAALYIGEVKGAKDQDVIVPVNMLHNHGVYSLKVTISFDAANLALKEVKSGLFELSEDVNVNVETGKVTLYVEYPGTEEVGDIVSDGPAFYLVFTVLNETEATYAIVGTPDDENIIAVGKDFKGVEVEFVVNAGAVTVVAEACNHDNVEEKNLKGDSCADATVKVKVCTDCGEVTEVISVEAGTGHTWDAELDVVKLPTRTTSDSYVKHTCSVCGAVEYYDYEGDGLYGDVNEDGKITSADAILLFDYLAAEDKSTVTIADAIQHNNFDFNGDGEVDAKDAQYLLLAALISESYDLEYPEV